MDALGSLGIHVDVGGTLLAAVGIDGSQVMRPRDVIDNVLGNAGLGQVSELLGFKTDYNSPAYAAGKEFGAVMAVVVPVVLTVLSVVDFPFAVAAELGEGAVLAEAEEGGIVGRVEAEGATTNTVGRTTFPAAGEGAAEEAAAEAEVAHRCRGGKCCHQWKIPGWLFRGGHGAAHTGGQPAD